LSRFSAIITIIKDSMKKIILFVLIVSGMTQYGHSQVFDPAKGCVVNSNGACVSNTQLTAMPFLRIVPDARGGGMGDVGIAIPSDANSMYYNASKLVFAEQDVGLAVTYTPWLRNLGLDDVYMAYLAGYKQIDDFSAVGVSMRFFSLGDISFTDDNGDPLGEGRPREMEFALAYSRKLGSNFSAGLTGKYIRSRLASGQTVGGVEIVPATAFAADISMNWFKEGDMVAGGSKWHFGLAATNIGSKVSYTGNDLKDFIPANLGIGTALELNFDEFNAITFALDINKLLTPSPVSSQIKDADGNDIENPEYSTDGDEIGDFRQISLFSGIFGSFTDAQGGFSEELREINYSLGLEYWYDKQFAVRAGYYFENPTKGDRQFLTVGVGIKYNVFGIDLSYLTPTNNRRNPLDNTLRFSLIFDFAQGNIFQGDAIEN